jgi:hypothetical protein
MRVLLVGVLLVVVLFFAGLFAPERSKKLERRVAGLLRKGERKAEDSAGKVGDATKASLKNLRKASRKSAETGRAVNEKAASAVGAARDRIT